MNNFISVIITTFNRSLYLEETLISIQNQTYKCIEIIVIDDGSIEEIAINNRLICNKFDKCRYYFKENTGQPSSRNYGIKRANGEYIAFCDDDDFWVLDKLKKQINIFNKNPSYSIVTGCIEYVDNKGLRLGVKKCHKGFNHGYIFEHLLVKNRTASITPLIKREVFDKVSLFDSNYTIAEDWEFWRRVSYYYKFYALDVTLGYVRNHSNNMSKTRNNTSLTRFLLYRKLTESLKKWGENKFNKEEFAKLISKKDYMDALKMHRKIVILVYGIAYFFKYKDVYFIKYIWFRTFKYLKKNILTSIIV